MTRHHRVAAGACTLAIGLLIGCAGPKGSPAGVNSSPTPKAGTSAAPTAKPSATPTAAPTPYPVPTPADATAAAGMQLYYTQNCYTCHGPKGAGDSAPTLIGEVITRAKLDAIIASDPDTNPMPAYASLTSEQRDQLVAFIAYLKTNP